MHCVLGGLSTTYTADSIIPRSTVSHSQPISRHTMLYSIHYIPTATTKPTNSISVPIAPPSHTTKSRLTASQYSSNRTQSRPSIASPKLLISKKYFIPDGMAPSEWTCSVRAVGETAVADYSAPGVNSSRRVPYRDLIAVSPFLRVLLVSFFTGSL